MWRSTSAPNWSSGRKRATSSASTNWPVLVSLACSELTSLMSRPNAARFSGPAEKPEHQRQPAALVAADRHEHSLRQPAPIGDRLAVLAVDDPALRHRLALERIGADRAVGGDRGGDVEHHRGFLPGRDRDRDRVGSQKRLGAAPGRHEVGAGHRAVDADHAVLERYRRIGRGGAGMIGAPRADPGETGLARDLDRQVGHIGHHQMAHAVVAVDQRGRGAALDAP